MQTCNTGHFTKTITLTDNAMQNPNILRPLRRGQWVAYNGSKGQFIGVDYNNVVYVAWYQRGMTMQQRNAKLRNLTIAFLNILTDQEIAQQRRDARALQLAIIRYRIARMLSFVLSILKPTPKPTTRVSVTEQRQIALRRARFNNLHAEIINGVLFMFDKMTRNIVYTDFDGKTPVQFLDDYARGYTTSYAK